MNKNSPLAAGVGVGIGLGVGDGLGVGTGLGVGGEGIPPPDPPQPIVAMSDKLKSIFQTNFGTEDLFSEYLKCITPGALGLCTVFHQADLINSKIKPT